MPGSERMLRPQAQVLRGAVRLGHQVRRLALLLQPRRNGPGQVRLSGARQAREQQGVARQAVAYRVVHPVPPPLFGALRLHARRSAAAQQRPRLFHAVDRRAVRVAQLLQRPQPLREALRQPLRQQAVRLHLRQVARRRVQDGPVYAPSGNDNPVEVAAPVRREETVGQADLVDGKPGIDLQVTLPKSLSEPATLLRLST